MRDSRNARSNDCFATAGCLSGATIQRIENGCIGPKRSVAIPMRNGSVVAPIRSKPHVQRAQDEQRRQEATDDDSERAEGGEEVQKRSDEVQAYVMTGRCTAETSRLPVGLLNDCL